MSEILDYPSRMGDPASRRFGTFSYLPGLDEERVRAQVRHLLDRGWVAAVEHVEPARASHTFWYLWKLPLFGVTDPDEVMAELARCRDANPGHHIRLIGYDRHHQTQGLALVAYRGA